MTESNVIALNMNRERPAATMSGYMMLALLLLSILAQVWSVYELANDNEGALQIATVLETAPHQHTEKEFLELLHGPLLFHPLGAMTGAIEKLTR